MATMSGVASSRLPADASRPLRRPGRRALQGPGRLQPPRKRAAVVGCRSRSSATSSRSPLLVLIPILWPEPPPEHPDYIRALIYNPPPPPPPPLPKGSALIEKPEPAQAVTPDPKPEKPELTAQIEVPKEVPLKPEAREPGDRAGGQPRRAATSGSPRAWRTGSRAASWAAFPGASWAACIGGTGDGPVLDYDQPPRPIKITRPQYPQEAFVKKIEGTVEVEILIDATGRVAQRARRAVDPRSSTRRPCRPSTSGSSRPPSRTAARSPPSPRAPVTFRIF